MKKYKIVVGLLLVALFMSFSFSTKTFANSNQSGSSVGIYFENDYTPSDNNPAQPTTPINNNQMTYPKMGEVIMGSISFSGVVFVLVVTYFYFRNKKKYK